MAKATIIKNPLLIGKGLSLYRRLVKNLDIPFKLDQDTVRKGKTHVHQAIHLTATFDYLKHLINNRKICSR